MIKCFLKFCKVRLLLLNQNNQVILFMIFEKIFFWNVLTKKSCISLGSSSNVKILSSIISLFNFVDKLVQYSLIILVDYFYLFIF